MKTTKDMDWSFAHRLGVFFVLLLIVCFVWYFVHDVEQALHMNLFKISFIGFSDFNIASFVSAAIQAYIWAYILVGLWGLSKIFSLKK